MADRLSSEKRSQNMRKIKGKDTSIEILVRKRFFMDGLRYRKNYSKLPGKPDIVLPNYKTAIFVHGCFWHRHAGCKRATTPKTRQDYWIPKIESNLANDKKNTAELELMGWRVLVIWECEIKKSFEETMTRVINEIHITKKQD